jgi:pimeloyl-ACP methyl ester carboxylesterase
MASRTYDWQDQEISYTRRGLGDPLLLVHNLYPGASREEFDHNIAELSRHFTVYAIDLLGFGESAAPRIKYTAARYVALLGDFVQHVIEAPANVMATGLSCAYVTEMAVTRPELVRKLVYVCPRSEPIGLETPRWIAPLQRLLLSSPLGSSVYDTLAGEYELASYLQRCFFDPRRITAQQIHRLHEQAVKPGSAYACASLMTGFLDSDILKSLPRVKAPILLLWGRHARPQPVEHSVRFSSVAPNCRLHVVEQAGAWAHYEQSAKVNRLVEEYLGIEATVSAV